jgi:hypothetical protein|tara:strand:- start:226 stop:525 length:300 start_codon:yes stop_codon:yes gene_type:complete
MKLSESKIKQIIKEEMDLMEMEIDPFTIAMGVGGLYGLYRMFFGDEPTDAEMALQRVRDHVNQLETQSKMSRNPPAPPAATEKERLRKKLQTMYQTEKQ